MLRCYGYNSLRFCRAFHTRDYYADLGISRNATPEQIKQAYRKEAMKWHPDRNKSPEAAGRFKRISEAYSALSSSGPANDHSRSSEFKGTPFRQAEAEAMFRQVFGHSPTQMPHQMQSMINKLMSDSSNVKEIKINPESINALFSMFTQPPGAPKK
eukprot:NODE_6202_length_561_cov_1.149770_g6037_i0.p1 GENE.NODE_6202_length_561_cov_1.149770_g6037_i0~~NODE_6202_length_561_cov_1.149770_g6037_i0.p1  ORF type:complete len:165 (+),score=32.01 NODE_6202_length_561_cov_1.149770_g6037_i0:28-495(+)